MKQLMLFTEIVEVSTGRVLSWLPWNVKVREILVFTDGPALVTAPEFPKHVA